MECLRISRSDSFYCVIVVRKNFYCHAGTCSDLLLEFNIRRLIVGLLYSGVDFKHGPLAARFRHRKVVAETTFIGRRDLFD